MRRGQMVTTLVQAPDGAFWWRDEGIGQYDEMHYVYWRPAHPEQPGVCAECGAPGRRSPAGWRCEAHILAPEGKHRSKKDRDAKEYVPPPPPQRPAFVIDPAALREKPLRLDKTLALATASGWATALLAAIGATGERWLVLKASRGPERVAIVWRWSSGRWGTIKGQPKFFPAAWGNDSAYARPHYPGAISHTQATEVLGRDR
jgi:hypothetical protein